MFMHQCISVFIGWFPCGVTVCALSLCRGSGACRTEELGQAIKGVLAEDAGPTHLVAAQAAIDRLQHSRWSPAHKALEPKLCSCDIGLAAQRSCTGRHQQAPARLSSPACVCAVGA